MLSRRLFLRMATRISTGLAVSKAMRGWGSAIAPLSIRLRDAGPLAHVPANFIGLGYEKSSVAVTGLLNVTNYRYAQLVRNLSTKGVLRIGGIVSDFSRYDPEGRSIAEPKNTVITRANLEQLAGFLKKTGWTAIWSLNFGQGTLVDALSEVKDVAAIVIAKAILRCSTRDIAGEAVAQSRARIERHQESMLQLPSTPLASTESRRARMQ